MFSRRINTNLSGLGTEGVLIIAVFLLIKDLLIPMYKRLNGRGKGNPINLDRFYQEFKDFKVAQGSFNKRIEGDIERLEDKISKPRRR